MKIVNKYILASCVFCYFAGIYLIASKMGIMRLISRYGLSRTTPAKGLYTTQLFRGPNTRCITLQ